MKYFLVAGEASGDLHSSNLMKALKVKDSQADFRFFGGDLMAEAGGSLVKHYREMAFMGFTDVVMNIRTIGRNLRICRQEILSWKPDVVILTDYAGFNLRIAEFAREKGFRVFYYISPKVWAWKKSRIKKLKAFTDRVFVIFPFEVDFFRKNGLEVEFHGNPLADAIADYRRNQPDSSSFSLPGSKPVVALLAGSRKQEIRHLLPPMISVAQSLGDYRFIIAGAPSIPQEYYKSFLADSPVELLSGQTYHLLDNSYAAMVTSGTATLETALFRVPQVVVYKTGRLTFALGRLFVRIKFFSLVNLIAGKEVVKELLQYNIEQDLRTEMLRILNDADYRKKMITEYEDLSLSVGTSGTSQRIADAMIKRMQSA
jgi:lipid-A-disaccharide synthase